ncbi:hypothetical protein DFS34DRAFT_609711 [Phlyctochytrium arcticum]|nr:hypothetical protein DFS34DRAFT_609711 [Phlyctochytrium arcticum]
MPTLSSTPPPAAAMVADMIVDSICIYPVKSCAGVYLASAAVGPYGLDLDRFWALSSLEGKQVDQRKTPRMALIRPRLQLNSSDTANGDGHIPTNAYQRGGQLIVSAPDMEDLVVPFKNQAEAQLKRARVNVWDTWVDALDEGDEAAEWFSKFLGRDVRLLVKDVHKVRPLPAPHTPSECLFITPPQTAFADGFPFLFTSVQSLNMLNAKLTEKSVSPVTMSNFRPNVTLSSPSLAPFQEDTFTQIRIQDHDIYFNSRCARCVLPNNNPTTGVPHIKEPLATLMQCRRVDPGDKYAACFGMNATHADCGWVLAVGDAVAVVQTGDHDLRGIWKGGKELIAYAEPLNPRCIKKMQDHGVSMMADKSSVAHLTVWWPYVVSLSIICLSSVSALFWSWWPS